jgi:arylsulfatase A-like enzyme
MMLLTRRRLLSSLLACTIMSAPAAAKSIGGGRRPGRRPNIITIILDDLGYSDLGCFGGEIHTPHIDGLARRGLRYTDFNTKAVCSASRAALLTGRNAHSVNMFDVPDVVVVDRKAFARDAFHLPLDVETLPQALKKVGYTTWNIGKWHLIPVDQIDGKGNQDCWPLQRGFDYFYGFTKGWTDQFKPQLVENNAYIAPDLPADYHFSQDIADKSIGLIKAHVSERPDEPFYLNLAFGTAHAPIQVPAGYADKYDGVYAAGWDEIRTRRFHRMLKLGLLPEGTTLPPRSADDRAWDDLSEDEKIVFARYMAVYAGFIEHADVQIGRLLAALHGHGLDDDTIIVLLSDNGPAPEAGQAGEFDGLYRPNRLTPAQQRARLAELGTVKTQAEYPRPWAMASAAPLSRYKLWPFAGGVRTPMITVWPGKIHDPGAIRTQFIDIIDIAPTLIEAAGSSFRASIGGTVQRPVAGRSFARLLTVPHAQGPRAVQYFELRGNRAITAGRWRAVSIHECGAPFATDEWQFFDLANDFAEATNVADREPAKLKELALLWQSEWAAFSPVPFREPPLPLCKQVKG